MATYRRGVISILRPNGNWKHALDHEIIHALRDGSLFFLGGRVTDRFDDHFTPAQRKAVLMLIGKISERTQIAKISRYNQYAAKACPGFNVPQFIEENAG